MKKVIAVIRREFVGRVRTKGFVISTVMLPVFIVLATVVPGLMMSGSEHTSRVAVVDASQAGVAQPLSRAMQAQNLADKSESPTRYMVQVFSTTPDKLAAVRDGLVAQTGFSKDQENDRWDGVLVIADDTLKSGHLVYYGGNVGALSEMSRLQSSVTQALVTVRLGQAGVDPQLVLKSMKPAQMRTTKVSDGKPTGQSGEDSFFIAYFMGFILYLSILIYGQQTMASVVEEKTSRIMEVLTSSMTPFEMLLGKVLGVSLSGLTQMAIWGGTVLLVSSQRLRLADMLGISADTMQSFPIPTMAPSLLVVFLLYFVLGFLLYGAIYAAIGAMCNTIQETQQYAVFVTVFIMVGFFAVFSVIKDPTSGLGATMSYIPFFAPFTMPVRWSMTTVSPLQLSLSLGVMVIALLACVWIAARIYRTGILMYGKKPGWRELWRWVRA